MTLSLLSWKEVWVPGRKRKGKDDFIVIVIISSLSTYGAAKSRETSKETWRRDKDNWIGLDRGWGERAQCQQFVATTTPVSRVNSDPTFSLFLIHTSLRKRKSSTK